MDSVLCKKRKKKRLTEKINRNGECSGESLKSKALTRFSAFRGSLLNTNSACWNFLWYYKLPAATRDLGQGGMALNWKRAGLN